MAEKPISKDTGNCKVVNIFKTDDEEERKKLLQEGIANIICRTESNEVIKYIRVK
ncbi:hypothetical protein [Anaerovorax odorimutans]|uniref:hypothetical protein n=1 Tax=Anaerovorax odorimutans TaxID=109327 RepID=UPI00041FE8E8|nr:hypothetical protein [Anaerovorax odorimutans]